MIFIWRDGQFYGCKVGFIETYNEAIKKGRLETNQKFHILATYYRTLNNVNEKIICSKRAWNKMNGGQKNNIVFVRDSTRNNVVHLRKDGIFHVGFANTRDGRTHSKVRYCNFIKKFKPTGDQLTDLKQKYPGFSLTWF